ncbi:hypothetical protein HW276_02200 [Leptotrichia sp. oral taxon 417]|jgi:hypothetical protein|uniref:hypothetical protein n=1 Tax=Leptotrichia sp. oral taxon 417 TaxID=712365 RepID=UPI0015BFDAA2|nr:hypothetical protein [Leptotrichia sp. oral taxon 417]NWO26548.1 hypothetical protein [Leptotrichia sp. oral taxon 417]DAT87236.1 MAG TPA: hypothetical protein [Caudoviricetes sp.]
MAKFRQIQTDFWSNPYVQEEMTPEDKFFYLYLMTNEKSTQIGIYKITKKQIAFDMGYSIESVGNLLKRFMEQHKLIKYDSETREIILLEWAKTNLNKGGKPFEDLILSELKEVKQKEFIEIIYHQCEKEEIKKIIEKYIDNPKLGEKNLKLENKNISDNLDDEKIIEAEIVDENTEKAIGSPKNTTFDDTLHEMYNDKGAINNNNKNKYNNNYINNSYYNNTSVKKEKNNFSFVCEEIKNKWIEIANTFGLSGTRLKINEKRKKSIKTLLKEYTIEEIFQAMDKIYVSKFLQGDNKNNWQITFDWFINKANLLKVLEGNYDDKVNTDSSPKNTKEYYQKSNNQFTGVTDESIEDLIGGIMQ